MVKNKIVLKLIHGHKQWQLLFINMSGQETNFGQMECLRLISANSLIEKRIGYLGMIFYLSRAYSAF